MATCSWVEVPVARVLRDFRNLFRDFLAGRTSSREKHLQNFSKFFLKCSRDRPWRLARDLVQSRKLCVYTIKAFSWTGFKNFSFFPRISRLFILLSFFYSFRITVFTHNISIFFFTSSPIFKERYRFCFFLNIFYISFHIPLGLCVSIDICVSDV